MVDDKAIDELVAWMADGAQPFHDGRRIVAELCERLNRAGVPVDLYRLFLFTIHPTIMGRRLQWTAAAGTQITEADFALFETDQYTRNPLPRVIETRRPLRLHLADPGCPRDYIVVEELRAAGFTDYLCQPVIYVDGEVHTMSWSSRHPGGFSPAAVAALERIRAPLTRLIESYILRLNAANIISTYVGRGAGERVLRGHIRRGDAEEIAAVILFADLKSYTELSNRESAVAVLGALNRFFDAFEEPIRANGGEILKFMGDGLLAIFPVRDDVGGTAGEAARAAAARGACAAVDAARAALVTAEPAIGFRSAVHVGRLSYGNIGASRRLDFTAIGPAVNLAARLLSVASSLGRDDVCSAEIAALIGSAELVSSVALKGFAGEQAVYARAGG
ncbi:MAG: adenylate cyclase [Alphaproteobacteria bacterium]|nr:MAG: adenylate cyclase [Alphaproteobacteria bacterium]